MIELVRSEQIEQYDHYLFIEKSQLSTRDVTVTVDFEKNEIIGDRVAHGSWYDLDEEQCVFYLNTLVEDQVKRDFRKMIEGMV